MSSTKDSGSAGRTGVGTSLAVVVIAALAGFAAVYVTMGRPDNGAKPQSAGTAPVEVPGVATGTGKMAAFVRKKAPEALPDIEFNDAGGKPLKLSDFKGKTVLLNLWATWCAPCREEMPALDRLQKEQGGDKFEVVALSLDRKGVEATRKFLDEVKASNLKLYIDATAKQGTVLKIVGMPTTFLIDADGREVGRLAGPAEWGSAEAKKLIAEAMSKPQ